MRWLTAVLVGALWACGLAAAGEMEKAPEAKWERIEYRVIPMENFAAVVKNKGSVVFQSHHAIRKFGKGEDEDEWYALSSSTVIRNLDEWNSVFSPAVVMGDERPTAPDEAFFEDEALVVLLALGFPAQDGEQPLRVVRFEKNPAGSETTRLRFYYDFGRTPETEDLVEVETWVEHTFLLAISQADACHPVSAYNVRFMGKRRPNMLNIGIGYTF